MDISKLNYRLDESLIAKTPVSPRDNSRLMFIDRKTKDITHHHFYDLASLLKPSDILVVNNSKVFPARLIGKKETGGKIELLLTKRKSELCWEAIHKGKLKEGEKIFFDSGVASVLKKNDLTVEVEIDTLNEDFFDWISKWGKTPLPPYIENSTSELETRKDYQTVYAKDEGSSAAPTAGLHFTESLINRLIEKGATILPVTLHVGLGTFLPIKSEDITKHLMHSEIYQISTATLNKLNQFKNEGRRIIAVGTTSLRTLETVANENGLLDEKLATGSTNIYIYPPYKMKFVDGLITNFHLPKTTLIALVSAFVSFPNTDEKFENFQNSLIGKAYELAQKEKFRLFSYGDASLIL